jgi:putative sigma-54 modulation protein
MAAFAPCRRWMVRSVFNQEGRLAMKVEITGRHIEITPAIRSYVMKRLRKFVKVLGEDISFHVIIDVEKERQTAEILLKTKLLDLTGKGQTDDMYASIIKAIEKIERQAMKHKSKMVEGKRQRTKTTSVAMKAEPRQSSAPSRAAKNNGGIQEEEARRKPMTVEEAVIELSHSEYPFIVFRNSESGDVNVLYRRKDESLGLVRS